MLLVSLFSPFPYPAGRALAEASKEAPAPQASARKLDAPLSPLYLWVWGGGETEPAGKKVCTLRFLTIGTDSKTLHTTAEDV